MYLCICNAISISEFRAAATAALAGGAAPGGAPEPTCAEDIYAALGYQPQCRQCLDEADRLLDDIRAAGQALVPVSA